MSAQRTLWSSTILCHGGVKTGWAFGNTFYTSGNLACATITMAPTTFFKYCDDYDDDQDPNLTPKRPTVGRGGSSPARTFLARFFKESLFFSSKRTELPIRIYSKRLTTRHWTSHSIDPLGDTGSPSRPRNSPRLSFRTFLYRDGFDHLETDTDWPSLYFGLYTPLATTHYFTQTHSRRSTSVRLRANTRR